MESNKISSTRVEECNLSRDREEQNKVLEFGTIIVTPSGKKYRVLCHEPSFDGHVKSVLGSSLGNSGVSVKSQGTKKSKGKIFVYEEGTKFANWYSLDDFEYMEDGVCWKCNKHSCPSNAGVMYDCHGLVLGEF